LRTTFQTIAATKLAWLDLLGLAGNVWPH